MALTTDEPFSQALFFAEIMKAEIAAQEAFKHLADPDAIIGRHLKRAIIATREARIRAYRELGFAVKEATR